MEKYVNVFLATDILFPFCLGSSGTVARSYFPPKIQK